PPLIHPLSLHDALPIFHAHSTALFIAGVATFFRPYPALVWHDHYAHPMKERPVWLYRPAASRINGVIAVNDPLADWSRRRLRIADRKSTRLNSSHVSIS